MTPQEYEIQQGFWKQTYTGLTYTPRHPHPDQICIEDIAHSLSMICRFNGHTKEFYSVAEHCFWVAAMIDENELCLEALLHDASEAYLCDISRPIKPLLEGYKDYELITMQAIWHHFGLGIYKARREIKAVDYRMLETERLQLMAEPPVKWDTSTVKPYTIQLYCWDPATAKEMFLQAFEDYKPLVA